MFSPTKESNASTTSPTRATASTPPLGNTPPTRPAPNAPSITSSDNADPNINRDNVAPSSSGSSGIDGIEEMSGEGPAPPVGMTEAAAIIVAKQRRGAPGVEQDGIHDTAPTPYAKAPDVEDEAGKSLGNTSKNNHVDHNDEDDGAHPFDTEEFEDGGVGKKMMTRGGNDPNDTQVIEEGKEEEKEEEEEIENNEEQDDDAQDEIEEVEANARRPRDQAVMLPTRGPPRSMLTNDNDEESMLQLEATLVPYEPVYDGVPLEPALAWHMQEKTRKFFAFVCIMFLAAVALILGLFTRSSGSSVPEDLSPSIENVTVVPLILSTIPSMSFAPSTPPLKTSHPSNLPSSSFLPSSSPTNTCFVNSEELEAAVSQYILQDCAKNENCNVARIYGYPMNSWCVGQINDMSDLFTAMSTFNEDISKWDVSSVTEMDGMFREASAFNSDLSEWDVSSVTDMYSMFFGASAFNSDLSEWDVSSVTNMRFMFSEASAFNSDLSEWDVSSVMAMDYMFRGASDFNSDLSEWDVSSLMDMYSMFSEASAFNSDLSEWDVSSVMAMDYMFNEASAFNSDLSEWDVSSVTNMRFMFSEASAFNSDLSEWDVSSVMDMYSMFRVASAFNQDLCAWSDKLPYNNAYFIFFGSGCTFQNDPDEQQGGPFCASMCSE